jgi:hypothetical protein
MKLEDAQALVMAVFLPGNVSVAKFKRTGMEIRASG